MSILIGILFAFLMYLLLEKIYKKIWNKGLTAEIEFVKKIAVEGDKNELVEIITNKKFLPLPILKVRFLTHKNITFGKGENSAKSDKNYRADVFTMLPYQKITRTLPFDCKKRGYYTIDDLSVTSSDPFMVQTFIDSFSCDTSLLVYPKGVDANRLRIPFVKMMGTVISQKFSYEDPFEFRTIRQYQSFDSMKNVNWKASAKTGDLLVNAHNYTVEQEVCILLNFDSDTTVEDDGLKEEALQIACTLSDLFAEEGIGVSFYTNGRDMITGEELFSKIGSGKLHALAIKEKLARIEFSIPQKKFIEKFEEISAKTDKNTLPIMITPSTDKKLQESYFTLFENNSVWIATHRPGNEPEFEGHKNCLYIPWEVMY